jgi:hypothetical protein
MGADMIDYKGILDCILEHKELLPLLMGKHPELDKIISKEFKK